MNRTIELIWLRIREYFKHPVEDLRQAKPIVPGRLYSNFGYVCKAKPLSKEEIGYISAMSDLNALPACLFYDRPINDVDRLRQLHGMVTETTDAPVRCEFCDLYRLGLPCPVYNMLEDGSVVCDTNKYVILKNQR